MTDLAPDDLPVQPLGTASLLRRKRTAVTFAPDQAARTTIALALNLLDLPVFRMAGTVTPEGRHDLRLEARLMARVVQPCSVTLVPVTTQIDEPVLRRYLSDFSQPEGDEVELSEDDSPEPLTDSIDIAAVAIEALALALPLYPRAPGADLSEAVFGPPGAAPLKDADLRPFAGLAALVAQRDDKPKDGA